MASSSKQPSYSPTSRSPSPSRVLTTLDVQQGNILWLAPRAETRASLRKRSQYASEPVHNITIPGIVPDDGFYNHPILVVSRPSTMPDTIHFVHLTSFSGQKLEKRFRKGASVAQRRNYLTMAPGSSHPLFEAGDPMYRILHLENDEAMERRGYVKVSEIYSMNWRDAQPFWRGDPSLRQKTRLDTTSLQLVMLATQQLTQYSPGEQFVPSAAGSRRSSSKSPVHHDTATAAKASQQPLSRRPSSLPERGKPLSLSMPEAGSRSPPRAPLIVGTTMTPGSQIVRRRSATLSLPEGNGGRVWDVERQPLLTEPRQGPATRNGQEALGEGVSYGRRMFMGLKNAVIGTFRFLWSLVRFIARILFR